MKSVTVSVFGSEFSVKADSDGEHIQQVASVVDRKMQEMERRFAPGSSTRTAVLACMNLVDEHLTQRQEDERWISRRVGMLIDKLESALGPGKAP